MRILGIAAAALLAVSAIAAGAYERISNGGITEHPMVVEFFNGFSGEDEPTTEDSDWRLTDPSSRTRTELNATSRTCASRAVSSPSTETRARNRI